MNKLIFSTAFFYLKGAVDGTLIPIQAPKDDEHVFVCRKGYHALNIQGVVEHELR